MGPPPVSAEQPWKRLPLGASFCFSRSSRTQGSTPKARRPSTESCSWGATAQRQWYLLRPGELSPEAPPSNKQVRDWQLEVTRRYAEARAPYERQERVERESLELLGRAMLEVFLESNPHASKVAQLLHMEEVARRLHTEECGAISHCVPGPRPRFS